MSFVDDAKHKFEEAMGKIERTVGGAIGDSVLAGNGEAHEEHGEAAEEASDHDQHAKRKRLAEEQGQSAQKPGSPGGQPTPESIDDATSANDAAK
ncbi:MAG: hypothetical protein ABI137_12985 [Antricoccus sp.]